MTSSGPRLGDLQTLLWRLLAAPEGAAKGAEALCGEGVLADPSLASLVKPSPRMSAVERVDVYADMYFYRLRDALAEDFPALAALIGAGAFHNLVTDYLLAHPSSHFSLRELGRAMPDFVGAHAIARRHRTAHDLARLEWARVDVFDAADALPITRDVLLTEGVAEPERFSLRRIPASRVLHLASGTLPLWRRLEGSETKGTSSAPEAGDATGPVLVWRRDLAVAHRSLDADEATCLEDLAGGERSLAALGERVAARQPASAAPEQAAARLATLLGQWTHDAVLTRGGEAA